MCKIISSGNFSTNSIIFIVCNNCNCNCNYNYNYKYKYKLAKCIYIYIYICICIYIYICICICICTYWDVETGDETNTWDNSKFDKLGNLKQLNEQLFIEVEVHDDASKDAKSCCL